MNSLRRVVIISQWLIRQALQARHYSTTYSMSELKDYEDAISMLNSLQSNATSIQNIKERIRRREECMNIKETWKFLNRTGVWPEDLHKLSVIHVAGTKGKGSTSALCESILRSHGYRTGFYSSPHLVSVVERIRLNGAVISKKHFAQSFHRIYRDLRDKQEFEGDLPGYFCFLTVLAFNVFLQEKVDVAVIEVGIGGENDITNVVNNVPVVGITSLGLEHTAILGDTIEQIAKEKAGIMKEGCLAYTVNQPSTANAVLKNVASIRKCPLIVVPDFDTFIWETQKHTITSESPAFKMNASLAIELAHAWMRHREKSQLNNINSNTKLNDNFKLGIDDVNGNTDKNGMPLQNGSEHNNLIFQIPIKTSQGLDSCFWPGRCQLLKGDNVNYYLDGAHTVESMEVCAHWFKEHTRDSSFKILIFNTTGDRNSKTLLNLLLRFNFDVVLFVPNVAFYENEFNNLKDQIDINLDNDQMMQKCNENLKIWNTLNENNSISHSNAKTLTSVKSALDYIELFCIDHTKRPKVLITGSIHLVGVALSILDPDLTRSQLK